MAQQKKSSLIQSRFPPGMKLSRIIFKWMDWDKDVYSKALDHLSQLKNYSPCGVTLLPQKSSDRLPNRGATKVFYRRTLSDGTKVVEAEVASSGVTRGCYETIWRDILTHSKALTCLEKHRQGLGLSVRLPLLYFPDDSRTMVLEEILDMTHHSKWFKEELSDFAEEIGTFIGLMIWEGHLIPFDFESCLSQGNILYLLDTGNFESIPEDQPWSLEKVLETYQYSRSQTPGIETGLMKAWQYHQLKSD